MNQTLFKTTMLLFLTLSWKTFALGAPCINIYYDYGDEKLAIFGRIHTVFLQNLLGHFPKYQQKVSPIELYKSGEIESCHATFYLGTNFNSQIPQSFFKEYEATTKPVVWAGYGIWKLPSESLRKLWNVKYSRLSTLDHSKKDSAGHPGFFKYIDYKGERFIKYSGYHNHGTEFRAGFEMTLLDPLDGNSFYSVATAEHSTQALRYPYILRNANHWYVADIPFSFMTEEDRYLVFADILFDVLGEEPIYKGKKPAVFRIEDIHPRIPLWQLFDLSNKLSELKVPFHLALIPFYVDPLGYENPSTPGLMVSMSTQQVFLDFLKYANERGAEFIFHGVTHQYKNHRNPFNGVSGDDFEFWNIVENRPIDEDSVDYVVSRLEDGWRVLEKSNAVPVAWETPHYQASPLDYTLFGQLFRWNIGRMIYFPFVKQSVPSPLPDALTFDVGRSAANGKRQSVLGNVSASYPAGVKPSGQFFPYEIYGDYYGQRVLPENVGNVQPYLDEHVLTVKTFADLERVVKRNSALRDVWASVFFHPFLLEDPTSGGIGAYPGDVSQVEKYIKLVREAGYEFVNLKEWMKTHTLEKRPPTIERYMP